MLFSVEGFNIESLQTKQRKNKRNKAPVEYFVLLLLQETETFLRRFEPNRLQQLAECEGLR